MEISGRSSCLLPELRAVGLLCLLLVGCQTTYYDEYSAQHDGFRPDLPRQGDSLEEVLASLYAPHPNEKLEVAIRTLEIHRTDVSPWEPVAFDALRAGEIVSKPSEGYAVVVDWTCLEQQGLKSVTKQRVAWYLLPHDGLDAWDHYGFRGGCTLAHEFRAARGGDAATESELTAQIAKTYGKTSLELDQVYRRGLAYVEAGRMLEARAMLALGERGFQAVEPRARRAQAEGGEDPLAEVRHLRASLRRALGVEDRPAG